MTIRSIRAFVNQFAAWSVALAAAASAQTVTKKPSLETFKIESNLRAGVAKIDVTPPDDTKVAGHVRPTHGARDPIRAAVLLLDDGRTRLAFAICDNVGISRQVYDAARALIYKETGLPADHILMAATHTHSATSAWYSSSCTDFSTTSRRDEFSTTTDSNGKYAISGVGKTPGIPPGLYKVVITKLNLKPGAKVPDEGFDALQLEMSGMGVNGLPKPYSDAATTKLSATLETGKNENVNFDLKDDGK